MLATPILVAHRSGNAPSAAARDQHRADAIEADVHVHRGRVVLRHAKVLWPTSRLWERWHLLPADTEVPELGDLLAAVDDDTPLWLDLKCFTRRTARQIQAAVPGGRELLVSSRAWWVLGAFDGRPDTTMLRSCGNRAQLTAARWLSGRGRPRGIVANERLLDDAAEVRAISSQTPMLATWAVTSPERAADLLRSGIAALIVDDLDLRWPRPVPPRESNAE